MKDIFKFKPYRKTESFYANLSALFLSSSIIFGPIAIIFGAILFRCYAIYLDDLDVLVYTVTCLVLFIISFYFFNLSFSKYKDMKKYVLKNLVKPRNNKDSYSDIYVLGTLVLLLLFVTSIYFINNNYKEKIKKLDSLKTSINDRLDKVSFTDRYKYIIIKNDNFTSSIPINKNINLSIVGGYFNYEVDSNTNTEDIINDFDNIMKVLFSHMNNYTYEEYYNEVNEELRESINNYKNGSLNDVYLYKRVFNNEKRIIRNLSVTMKGDKVIISLSYI